jgi:phosphoribosylformylglycinamidine cyclo-ligase
MPIGMALLEPTRLYVKPVLGLMEKIEIHGMAHITGGGFYENIPRMFPATPPAFDAVITEDSWTIPPIFSRIAAGCAFADNNGPESISGHKAQKLGAELLKSNAALKKQMFNTFNMGIGFVLALDPASAQEAMEFLDNAGFPAWQIGRVEPAISGSETAGRQGKGIVRFVKG